MAIDEAARLLRDAGALIKLGKSGKVRGVRFPAAQPIDEAQLLALVELLDVTRIVAADVPLRDEQLSFFARLPRLTQLDLQRTAITDAGLAHLAAMGSLKILQLSGTRISEDALKALRQSLLGTRIVYP